MAGSPRLHRGEGGSARRSAREGGFTLVELLTVIAIIAVLAGISFGVLSGVKRRAAEAKARVELAVLAQALEEYKRYYGDYPQTVTTSAQLYQSLNGTLGPTGASITSGRRFISGGQFALNDPDLTQVDNTANFLVDPWGNGYLYVYFHQTTPTERRDYVLYSTGPDGVDGAAPSTTDGTVDLTATGNADNIYANQ